MRSSVIANPLENAIRSRMLALVNRRPGISITEIARRLRSSRDSVRYHITVLERSGYVVVVRRGKIPAVMLNSKVVDSGSGGQGGRRSAETMIATLNHGVRRAIVELADLAGPISFYDYESWVERTGREEVAVARDTFRYHCNRLVEAGLLECSVVSRRTTWRIAIDLDRLVQHQREGLVFVKRLRKYRETLEELGNATLQQIVDSLRRRGTTTNRRHATQALLTLEALGLVTKDEEEGSYRWVRGDASDPDRR